MLCPHPIIERGTPCKRRTPHVRAKIPKTAALLSQVWAFAAVEGQQLASKCEAGHHHQQRRRRRACQAHASHEASFDVMKISAGSAQTKSRPSWLAPVESLPGWWALGSGLQRANQSSKTEEAPARGTVGQAWRHTGHKRGGLALTFTAELLRESRSGLLCSSPPPHSRLCPFLAGGTLGTEQNTKEVQARRLVSTVAAECHSCDLVTISDHDPHPWRHKHP